MTAPVLGRGIPTASITITTGNPPPSTAAKPGHPDPGIDLPDRNGKTPLLAELTMAKPDPDKIAELLAAGASVTKTLPTGENALTYAIAHKLTPQIIAILIDQAIADKVADLPDAKGVTPLFAAVRTEDFDTIANLRFNAGVNLEQVNAEGETPLMTAYRERLVGAQELLLKLGADVVPAWNLMLPEIQETLILSIPAPHWKLASLMLAYAFASAKALPTGRLPEDHILIALLKKEGQAPTAHWKAILHQASHDLYPFACQSASAEAGDDRLLLALLKSYGDARLVCEGCSCLTYAIRKHRDLVPTILSICDVNSPDVFGRFPLVTAVEKGDLEMVKWLVAKGAEKNEEIVGALDELPRLSDDMVKVLCQCPERKTPAKSSSGSSGSSSSRSSSSSDDEGSDSSV